MCVYIDTNVCIWFVVIKRGYIGAMLGSRTWDLGFGSSALAHTGGLERVELY